MSDNDILLNIIAPDTSQVDKSLTGFTKGLQKVQSVVGQIVRGGKLTDVIGKKQDLASANNEIKKITDNAGALQNRLSSISKNKAKDLPNDLKAVEEKKKELTEEEKLVDAILKKNKVLNVYKNLAKQATQKDDIERYTKAQEKLNKQLEKTNKELDEIRQNKPVNIKGQSVISGISSGAANLKSTLSDPNAANLLKAANLDPNKVNAALQSLEGLNLAIDQLAYQKQSVVGIQNYLTDLSGNIAGFSAKVNTSKLGQKLPILGKGVDLVSNGIGGLSTKLGGVVGVLGVAGIAVAAITATIDIMNNIMGTTTEQIQNRIDKLKDEARSYHELERIQSQEAAKEKAKDLQDQIAANEEILQGLISTANQNTNFLDQWRTVLGTTITGQTQVYGQAVDEINATSKEIEKLRNQLDQLNSQEIQDQIRLNEEQLKAEDRVKSAESGLFTLLQNAANEQETFNQNLLDIDMEYHDKRSELERSREEEDLNAYKRHQESLLETEQKYGEQVVEARVSHLKELVDLEKQYNEEQIDAKEQFDKENKEAEKEFKKTQKESEIEFRESQKEDDIQYKKQVAKAEEDFKRQRLRRLQDLQDSLFDAELNNDALAFMQAERQAEKDLKQMDEDHLLQMKESDEQQREQRAQSLKQHKEQMKDAKEAYEEQKQQRKEQYEEQKQQAKEQYDESVQAAKDKFAEEQELARQNHVEALAQLVEQFEEEQKQREINRIKDDMAEQEAREAKRAQLIKDHEEELKKAQEQQDLLLSVIESGGTKIIEAEDWTALQRIETLTSLHNDFMSDMNYSATENGLALTGELRRQNEDRNRLIELEGEDHLSVIRGQIDLRNQEITGAYEEQLELQQEHNKNFIAEQSDHFYDSETALERQYKDMFSIQTQSNRQSLQNQRAQNEQMIRLQQESHTRQAQIIQTSSQTALNSVNSAYPQIANMIINSTERTLERVADLVNDFGYSYSYSTTGNNQNSASNNLALSGYSGLAAAEGALIDKPTLLIAGEGSQPELVVPFDKSKGIPEGVMGGVNLNLTIESVQVGSNISRSEINSQFLALQQSLLRVVSMAVNNTGKK